MSIYYIQLKRSCKCNTRLPMMEKETDNVPNSGEEQSEDHDEVAIIQTTSVDNSTEAGTYEDSTEVFVTRVD